MKSTAMRMWLLCLGLWIVLPQVLIFGFEHTFRFMTRRDADGVGIVTVYGLMPIAALTLATGLVALAVTIALWLLTRLSSRIRAN